MWLQSPVELTLGGLDPPHYVQPSRKSSPFPVLFYPQTFDKGKLSKDLLKEVPELDKRDGDHEIPESYQHAPKNSINQSNKHPQQDCIKT